MYFESNRFANNNGVPSEIFFLKKMCVCAGDKYSIA